MHGPFHTRPPAPVIPVVRRSGWQIALDLWRGGGSFRGFVEFAFIGGFVLAFLHGLGPLQRAMLPGFPVAMPHAVAPAPAQRELPLAPRLADVGFEAGYFDKVESPLREMLVTALKAYKARDHATFDSVLASVDPDQPQALLLRGLRLVAMGATNATAGLASLERAMQRGEPRAAAVLGVLKASGAPGIPRDLDAARQLLERAAAVGDPAAARVLGEGYLSGWSGQVDPPVAARHLRASAERGDEPAMLRLADMYLRGTGVDKNEGEAERLLTAAARRGHPEAQALLGTWRLVAYGTGLTDDPAQALEWLDRAADKGHPKALYQLGMFYVEHGRRTGQLDLPRGVALFARCVEQGRDPDCLFAYASALDYGLGTPRDPVKAHVMYGLLQPLNPSAKIQRRRDELAKSLAPAELARAEAEVNRLMQTRDVSRSTVSLPPVGRGFNDIVKELRTDATQRNDSR